MQSRTPSRLSGSPPGRCSGVRSLATICWWRQSAMLTASLRSDIGAVFEHPVTVRWRDTDALGHVDHAVFLTYLEEGRDAFY